MLCRFLYLDKKGIISCMLQLRRVVTKIIYLAACTISPESSHGVP